MTRQIALGAIVAFALTVLAFSVWTPKPDAAPATPPPEARPAKVKTRAPDEVHERAPVQLDQRSLRVPAAVLRMAPQDAGAADAGR